MTAGKTAKVIATLFVACGLIFSSCKKGDTGPKGDKGDTGPQGQEGPSAKYADITANFNGTSSYISFPLYTVNNYTDGDAVITYFKDPANSNWLVQTPFTWYNGTSSPVAYFWSNIASATLFIYAQKPGFGQYTPAFTVATQHFFRVVVIKASQRVANPNVNYADYNEVKNTFNLPD